MNAGGFQRERLPDPLGYFEGLGLKLAGRGRWRTTRCEFHGGSDSMRINTASGGWICMSCGVSGGDVLAYEIERTGTDFVTAARALGAWVETDKPQGHHRPRRLQPRDALEVIGLELAVCVVVIADARVGTTPSESDWQRFLQAAGRVEAIAKEAAA